MSTIWDEIDRTIGRPSAAPRRTSVWDDIDRELARDEAADAELAQAGAPRPTLPNGPTLAELVGRRSAPPPPRETWDAPPPQMDLGGIATSAPTTEGARAAREMAAEAFGVARRAVTNVPRAIAAGVPRLNQGFWGGVQAIGESTGLEPVADFGRRAGAQAAQLATDIAGPQEGAGWAERAAYGGLQSVVPSVAALAAGAVTGNPAVALGAMGAMTGGTSYAEAREAGVPVPQALVYGASQGAVEAATERLPVGQLLGDLAQRTGLFRTVLHQIATEVPTEQAATVLQDLNEWATLTPERPLGDYLRERPSAAAETLVATIAATALQTGAMHLGARLAERGSGPPPGRPTPPSEAPASPPPVDEAQVAHAVEMQRQSQEAARRAAAQRAQQQAAFARYAAADAAAQQAPDTVPSAPPVDAAAVQRAVLASQDARRASRFDEFAQADPADTLAPAAAEEAQARVAAIERAQAEAKARRRAARGTRLPGASMAEQLSGLAVPEVRYADDPLTLAEREQVAAAGGDPMLAYGEVAAEMGWPEPVAGRRMDAPETPPAAPPLRREPPAAVEPVQREAAQAPPPAVPRDTPRIVAEIDATLAEETGAAPAQRGMATGAVETDAQVTTTETEPAPADATLAEGAGAAPRVSAQAVPRQGNQPPVIPSDARRVGDALWVADIRGEDGTGFVVYEGDTPGQAARGYVVAEANPEIARRAVVVEAETFPPRQGIGTRLYTAAAAEAGRRGLEGLGASAEQSQAAERFWGKLRRTYRAVGDMIPAPPSAPTQAATEAASPAPPRAEAADRAPSAPAVPPPAPATTPPGPPAAASRFVARPADAPGWYRVVDTQTGETVVTTKGRQAAVGEARRRNGRPAKATKGPKVDPFDAIEAAARERGYYGPREGLARAYRDFQSANEAMSEAAGDAAGEGVALLRAIAQAGGLGPDAAFQGELDDLWEASTGTYVPTLTRTRTGRVPKARRFPKGGLLGVSGVLVRSGGLPVDRVREAVADLPQFRHFADAKGAEFLDAVREAVARGRQELPTPTGQWWQPFVGDDGVAPEQREPDFLNEHELTAEGIAEVFGYSKAQAADLLKIAQAYFTDEQLEQLTLFKGGTPGERGESYRQSAARIRERWRRTDLVTVNDAAMMLGDAPPAYLEAVVAFMAAQRQKVLEGRLTVRDVAKAYLLTLGSIGADAINVSTLRKTTGFAPDPIFVTSDGKIRPEEAVAAWLMTDDGRALLDRIEAGTVTRPDFEELLRIRDAFGRNDIRNNGLNAEARGRNLWSLQAGTDELNGAKGDLEAMQRTVQSLTGISDGKARFIKHLLGFGDTATVDAVELNFWLTGRGTTRGITTRRAALVNALKTIGMGDPVTRRAVTARIQARLARLSARYGLPPEIGPHIMHHWLWDKAKGTETTHAGMMAAMALAQEPPQTSDYRGSHRPSGADSGAPLHDLTGDGRIYPSDVYGADGERIYAAGTPQQNREAFAIARRLKGKPDAEVTVYRAVPKGVAQTALRPGDWVAITRGYAEDHGARWDEGATIIAQKVRAREIFTSGDSIQEWGYWPQSQSSNILFQSPTDGATADTWYFHPLSRAVAAEAPAAPSPVPGTTIEPANDGWSVTTTREDGSRSSRWYATEDEARRAAGEVPGPAVPTATAAKLAVPPQTEARPLGTKRTGPPTNRKPPQAARRSGPPTHARRGVAPTPDLAHAVGTDAGNASMRAAGRTTWNEDDRDAAAAATNRIMDLVEEAPPAPTTLPDATAARPPQEATPPTEQTAPAAPRATTPAAPRPDPPWIGPAPSATTLDQAERVFKSLQQDEEAAQQALDQAKATWRKQRRNTRAEREASEAVTAAQKKHMDLVLKRQDAEGRLFTERLRAAYHDPATSWDRKWAIAAKLAGPDRDPTIRHRAYAVLKDAATADLLARGFTEADAEREAVTIAAEVTTYPLSDFYTLEQGLERAARAVAAKQAEQADRETLAALERQYGIQGTRFVIAANSSPEERAKVLREAEAYFQTRRAELDRESAAEQAATEERRARLAKWTAPGRFTARVPAGEPDDGFTLTLAPDLSDLGKVQRLIGIARSADFKLLPLRDQARIWDALDAVVVEEVEVREDEDGKKLKHPIPVMGERREKLAARIKDILDKADERLDAAATGATRTGRRTGPPSAKPKRAAGGRTPSGAASVGSTAHRGAGTQATLAAPPVQPPRTLFPVAVPEMVELAETLIGTPQVVKKFRSNAWGYFTGAEGAPVGKIRLLADLFRPGREQDLAATLAHEIGHLVDWLPDYTLKRGNLLGRLQSLTRYLKHTFDGPNGETIALADVRAELQALSDAWRPWNPLAASASFKAYRHSSKELYADAISVLLNDPGRLQAEAPTFFDAFMAGLSEKPDVETAFYELQALLSGTPAQLIAHRRDRVRAMWDKGTARWQEVEAQRREDLRAARRLTGEKWQQQLIETNAPFERRKAIVLARGGQIADEADPVFALEERNYLGGVRKAWMARHVEPMLARLAAAGVEQDALDEALFYERIIGGDFSQWNDMQWRAHWARVIEDRAKAGDRAGLANPLGITPDVAQQLHKDLRRDLGEPAWRVLQQELATFRRAVKAVAEAAHDAGLYTDETWDQIRDNETYATFRVIDHLDAQATSRIVQQIGTLKDVASPLTATIEKTLVTLMAAHYNRTVNLGLDFLKREFPEDIQPAETRWTGRHHEPVPPKTPGWELVTSLRKGKVEGVYVPEVIANSLNRERHGGTWAPIVALRTANNVWLRPLFTMLNLGFQTFNVPRDFLRTWKHQPLTKLLRGYRQAHGVARLRAFGPPSARPVRDWVRQLVTGQEGPARPLTAKEQQAYEDLLQAEESGLLSVTFNDLLHMNDAEDTQLEALFARSGLAPASPPPRFRAAHQIVEAIRNVGDYLETLPKAAVMLEDKGRGEVRALRHAQRAYIRRFVGSPDFLAGGTWKPVTNELLLFSHAILYAWRADLQLATTPKTRAEWWWKTAVYNLGPKLFLAAAYFGALGAGDDDDDWRTALARMLRRINEFDLTNYNVVPLAEVDGKTFYLRLPQDDTGRFVGGLFWKAIKASQGDGALLRDLADVFSYGSGQLPSVNPFITAAGGAASYLAGQNPYDSFRGRPLFTDEEMRRGGDLGKFLKWEADQLGLSLITAWLPDGTKVPREEGALDTALKLPILGRWFKVSDVGARQALWDAQSTVERQEAEDRHQERRKIAAFVRDARRSGEPPTPGGYWAEARAIADDVYADLPAADRAQKTARLVKKLQMGYLRAGADPLTDVLLGGGSNAQKAAAVRTGRRQMGREDFEAWRREARRTGVLSVEVEQLASGPPPGRR